MHSKCVDTCFNRCYFSMDWTTGFCHLGGGFALFLFGLSFYGAMRGVADDHVLFACSLPIFFFSGWTASELNTTGMFDWHGFVWPIVSAVVLGALLEYSGLLTRCERCSRETAKDTSDAI
jgi:hypothetical protein